MTSNNNDNSKGRCQKKKRENVGILKKTGGGSTRIPLPFFTVFNMGDPPTINVPIGPHKHVIPKQGGRGGGLRLGKNSHIFPFFLEDGSWIDDIE